MNCQLKVFALMASSLLFACTTPSQAENNGNTGKDPGTTQPTEQKEERPALNPSNIPVVDKVLTKAEAASYLDQLTGQWKDSVKVALTYQYEDKVLAIASDQMKIWWALHGGGGAPAALNDQQWENQKRLYQPAEGVYLAPRAITNTWDLHFVPAADNFYERIIQMAVAYLDVNPNKVYLMGYSAGGDGVWRLGPRMADHWAAASMMAGHPGDVTLFSLRNTPFMIWCGALDDAYNRNEECTKRIAEMDQLQAEDPGGYIHEGHIMEGKGHWMDGEDKAAVPWMAKYTRNPYPDRVVWCQGDVMKAGFYWLGVSLTEAEKGKRVSARLDSGNNTVEIEESDYKHLIIWLNDSMADLDKPVKVVMNGEEVFNDMVERNANTMRKNLIARGDPNYAFPAKIEIEL